MNQVDTHILVVDDELPIRLTVSDLLRRRGFQVTQAADGAEAMRLVQAKAFDLLLLDVELPGLSGLEVARRARERQPEVPILILTGLGALDGERDDLEQSAFACLRKTASPQDVIISVQGLLGQHQ